MQNKWLFVHGAEGSREGEREEWRRALYAL